MKYDPAYGAGLKSNLKKFPSCPYKRRGSEKWRQWWRGRREQQAQQERLDNYERTPHEEKV